MSPFTVAFGVPHKPDNGGARDRSLADLLEALRREGVPQHVSLRIFDEVKPNRAWARDMWSWGAKTEADFFLTLQDDVRVCPRFWHVLDAMLARLPRKAVLGLAAQDARIGPTLRPWAVTRAWVVGWGYGMWRDNLKELYVYDLTGEDSQWTEDTFVNEWAKKYGHDVWHPVPTPVQHRTEIPSTYSNWPKPATYAWEDAPKDVHTRMTNPAYWAGPAHRLEGMVQAGATPPAHSHVAGSPNYGGSPPAPWTR